MRRNGFRNQFLKLHPFIRLQISTRLAFICFAALTFNWIGVIIAVLLPILPVATQSLGMSLFQSLLAESRYELFWIVGDSNADGRGETIPTVPADTLYRWNGAGVDEITTQTVANATAFPGPYGSAWQQFAIDYKAQFQKRVVIVTSGSGGAEFYPNGDNNNWYTSGDLYAPAVAQALAAKAFLGATRVNVIICLGINDIRNAVSTSNITTGIESLRTRINTDLASPPIYYVLPGRDDTNHISVRASIIRRLIVNVGSEANSHVGAQTLPYENWGLMQADKLHMTQAGYGLLGSQLVRYMRATNYSKVTRTTIASVHTDFTLAQRAAWETFYASISNPLATIDALQCYIASSRNNAFVDFGLVSGPIDTPAVAFIANDCISFDGGTEYINAGCYLHGSSRATSTDVVEFAMLGTVGEASGTSAFLFGKSIAASARVYQGTNLLHVQAYDGTDTTYAETKFADDTIYGMARNNTTKMLKREAADAVSVVQAMTADINTIPSFLGTTNSNGTPAAQCIQAEVKIYGQVKLSNIVWSTFVSSLRALQAALETP